MDHDDDPTPADPLDSGIRPRRSLTTPSGVPTVYVERASRGNRVLAPDELAIEQLDPLDVRIDTRFEARFPASFDHRLREHNDKRFRRLWTGISAVAGAALVALAGVAKGCFSDAKTEGAAEYRIQIIERDAERARSEAKAEIERLRFEIDSLRSSVYRARRDDQPDPPVTGASRRTPP